MPDTMVQTDIEDPEYLGRGSQSALKKATPKSATVTILNKDLAVALSRAVAVTGRLKTIPILECVKLRIDDGTLVIEANNMEQALRQSVAVTGSGSGVGCVKAAVLLSIIQKLPPDEESSLDFGEAVLSLRCGRSRLALELFPLEDFPLFAAGHSPCRFTMAAADLALILGRVRPFVSNEVTRYYLCGIFLVPHSIGGTMVLRAAATNGNWLGAAWGVLPDGARGMPALIIPTAAIAPLMALLEGGGSVEISAADARVIFVAGGVSLATKLIDGTYPEIDRVMPRDNPNVLRVDRREFLRALALTGVEMGDSKIIVRLSLSPDAVVMSSVDGASAVTHELSDGSFEYVGQPMEIGFMNRLLEGPTKLVSDKIEFRFNGPSDFVTARDPADDSALYVIGSYRI